MRRLTLLVFLAGLVVTSEALATQGQHTVAVPVTRSSFVLFSLPSSVSARRVPQTPGTHGELTENTPQCRGGVIDGRCPGGSFDVVALPGTSPAAALHGFDRRDRVRPLAHGTNSHRFIWERFTDGSLVLVAPATCAELAAGSSRVCGRSSRGPKYVALLLTGSSAPTVLTRAVDDAITTTARFARDRADS